MPSGSRKPISRSSSMTTAANAPLMRLIASCTPSTREPGCSQIRAAMTSVSEVDSKRMPLASSSSRSSVVFVRLPLWPSASVRPSRWRTTGCAFCHCDEPVVE